MLSYGDGQPGSDFGSALSRTAKYRLTIPHAFGMLLLLLADRLVCYSHPAPCRWSIDRRAVVGLGRMRHYSRSGSRAMSLLVKSLASR